MRGCGHVISDAHRADRADATQRHRALAVLRRFLGVGVIELARRLRDRAEVFLHEGQRLGLIELTGDDQARRYPADNTSCRTPASFRWARARCRSGCRWWLCRSYATRRLPMRSAAGGSDAGLFSPRSNSLRTTVISDARSSPLMKLLTSRSHSSAMPNSRFSSVAGMVSK